MKETAVAATGALASYRVGLVCPAAVQDRMEIVRVEIHVVVEELHWELMEGRYPYSSRSGGLGRHYLHSRSKMFASGPKDRLPAGYLIGLFEMRRKALQGCYGQDGRGAEGVKGP